MPRDYARWLSTDPEAVVDPSATLSALYEVVAQSQPEPLLAAALLPIIFNAQSVA